MFSTMNLKQKEVGIETVWSEAQNKIDRMFQGVRQKWYGINSFKPKLNYQIKSGGITLRTAESSLDVKMACRFRYESFFPEAAALYKQALDIDKFDNLADHLLVFDDNSKELIGTYRILSSRYTNEFYTSTEFDLSSFFQLEGEKLELGRACVAQKYRSGRVIHLLWRGIAEYIKRTSPDFVFGCASVDKVDPLEVGAIGKFISLNYPFQKAEAKPKPAYQYPNFDFLSTSDCHLTERDLSPLFRAYLAAGALVMGPPAFDRDFMCVDFPIVLDMKNLDSAVKKKYFGKDEIV